MRNTALKYEYPKMSLMSNPQGTRCSRFRTSKLEKLWDKYHQYVEIFIAVIIGLVIGGYLNG